jgi:ABC-type multidrug transport system fused ATPase/permease subunit
LLKIISGLLRPEKGTVYVNGTDIIDLDLPSFYHRVAVVSQEPFLFSKSVAENIALGEASIDMASIRQAARNAAVEEEIRSFPDGYQQVLGERGITLSGGQKQRMAIARALNKCAPVLIMDDPLSSVDARTESQILRNLKEMKCYTLLILASHRISALKRTDFIYVLDEGRVVEAGSHQSLLRQNGLYARLARLQQMELG